MSYEVIVGLQVDDEEMYANYRAGMTPMLTESGGGFRYDFKVSEVLKSDVQEPINRVFAIFFADKKSMKSFFSNPKYLEVKRKYFEDAVSATTIISEYTR